MFRDQKKGGRIVLCVLLGAIFLLTTWMANNYGRITPTVITPALAAIAKEKTIPEEIPSPAMKTIFIKEGESLMGDYGLSYKDAISLASVNGLHILKIDKKSGAKKEITPVEAFGIDTDQFRVVVVVHPGDFFAIPYDAEEIH